VSSFLTAHQHLGYLAKSITKYDIVFLLSDPDFLQRWRNFAPISLSFEIWRGTDKQMTDRQQTTDVATKTEGSHTVSVW